MLSLKLFSKNKNPARDHKARTVNFITLWDEIITAQVMKNRSNYGETRTRNMYVVRHI